ncbi:hypothetical protein A8C35_10135 [Ligilactobacillus salivarius]|uniref:hypothetical protein n=1 Tax=Ligilactobacillus salivarius TaxID=1624 RepID=UPI000BB02FB7|nr:hypothetical protein [Ligilactobacillus salivarius]PAY31712.1 hypothetical protein A8C35_10135 [Ligilactobacillus salivarius]
MSKSDFRFYQFLKFWLNYRLLILMFFLTIIAFHSLYIGNITTSDFLGLMRGWIAILFIHLLVEFGLRYRKGYTSFKSMKLIKLIKVKLREIVKEDNFEKEKIKIAKNKAIKKSFGLIGKKNGFVAIRMPDDFRSADLLEPQLSQLAEFLSHDYGLMATSWERLIIRHHEYRILMLKS